MHYAITIKDGIITDLHTCGVPFTLANLDARVYMGQTFQTVPGPGEIRAGQPVAAYTPDWMLRPLIDRIKDGLADVPAGYELVNGELVATAPTETPIDNTPSTAELLGILLGGAL